LTQTTHEDAGSETAVKGFPETEEITSTFTTEVEQEEREPSLKVAEGTHKVENKNLKIQRTFRLTEDLENIVQDTKKMRDGDVVDRYTHSVSTDDVEDIKELTEKMHYGDPQAEFEGFREYGGGQ